MGDVSIKGRNVNAQQCICGPVAHSARMRLSITMYHVVFSVVRVLDGTLFRFQRTETR